MTPMWLIIVASSEAGFVPTSSLGRRADNVGLSVGLSHCQHASLVMVWDEAFLRQGHNDQSRRGHQSSETMLTGESRFHISTPLSP